MTNELDYVSDMRIDPDALDVEWLNQPELFAKYSDLLAEAKRKAKTATEKAKTIRSELILKINKDPGKFLGDGVKPSDPKVEACYRANEDHRTAKEDVIEAEFKVDLLEGAIFAFHQRKAALENLVRLANQNYFATPEVPRDLGSETEKFRKIDRKRVVEKIDSHRRSGRRKR